MKKSKSFSDSFDKTQYDPGTDDYAVESLLKNSGESLKVFIRRTMDIEVSKGVIRKDYYELLELSLIFLGGKLTKTKPNIFHRPGADHHARWMSKAIYALKIFLFRKQFPLTARQKIGFAEFCVFVVRHHIKVWFQCPSPTRAASLDLQFLKDMIHSIGSDKKLANAIIDKFSGHLWYLSEENIGMAFFDKDLPLDIKRKMVTKLCLPEMESDSSELTSSDESDILGVPSTSKTQKCELSQSPLPDEWDEDFEMDSGTDTESDEERVSRNSDEIYVLCERRIVVGSSEIIKTFLKKDLSDFVTKKTIQFFRRFQISPKFLKTDPLLWTEDQDYINGTNIVKNLKITNDTAERGVKILSDFLSLLSKDETETSYILQVVSESRKEFPSVNIKDLAAA